jgi:hypothetical protein
MKGGKNMDERIKLIRQCEWEEVFLAWYKNEGETPHWGQLAKERGFASWADWRINGYARRFECEKAKWGFYEVSNPSQVVLSWFGGPFRTWIERHYGGQKVKSFSELSFQPDITELPVIGEMMNNYPKESIITALELVDTRIFVIEGMHRACALAVMARERKRYPGKLIFAIGRSQMSELPAVGQNTSKGR